MKSINTSGFRVIFLAALVFLFALPVCGAEAQGVNTNIKMYFNGSPAITDVSPFIDENSRTMVPLRFISESMGAYVEWKMGVEEITIKQDGSLIKLKIGSNRAVVDDKIVYLDTKPVIRGGRTMVPLRFVGEQLGCLVLWSKEEQAVYINAVEETEQELIVNVSSYANIRKGPNTAYPVVSKVTNGTILEAIAVSGGWYQVILPDNSKGWISGTIVKLKDDRHDQNDEDEGKDGDEDDEDRDEDKDDPPFEIDGDSVIFIYDVVNIRTGPSTDYSRIGQAYKGQELAVLGEQGNWIKVKMVDGREGWVANWLVAYKKAPDARRNAPLEGKIIVIDPGHGSGNSSSSDPGAVSPSGLYERDINTKIAFKAGEVLSKEGATVIYTRTGATALTLQGRAELANNYGADVFVSVHCNASTNPSVAGTSTYYYAPASMDMQQRLARERLASFVQDELVKALGRRNIGILQANFAVLRHTRVPSILVETAFLSNPEEEALLRSAWFQERAGEAIAEGVIKFLKD